MSDQTKDILIRAGKTFAQTFISTLLVGGMGLTKDVLIAALAAAVSASWNVAIAK